MSSIIVTAANKNDLSLLQQALDGAFGLPQEAELEDALVRAANNGNTQCVAELLRRGVQPNVRDLDGDTPLMLASANNHTKVVRLLLEHKDCDVNLTSDSHRTALHMAAFHGRITLINRLMDAGADAEIQEKYGDSVLMMACNAGHYNIIRILMARRVDVNVRNHDHDTALHYAAGKGHKACTDFLLAAGAHIDAVNLWGYTPLFRAISCESTEVARILIEYGCDIHIKDSSGRTALHSACRKGMTETVKLLLKYRACPDEQEANGNTPLIESVYHNRDEIVKVLIRANCDMRVIGHAVIHNQWTWCTPLEIAIHRGNFGIAKILITAGCELNVVQTWLTADIGPNKVIENLIFLDWLKPIMAHPRSLYSLCRYSARKCMTYRNAQKMLHLLPLPKTVLEYLSYSDLDNIICPHVIDTDLL